MEQSKIIDTLETYQLYFYSSHTMCFAWVWYESLLVLLCVLSLESLLDTPFWESQKLCYACSYASLKFLEPRTCSSTSLISFWARCALLILKKCSHDSLRFIWELVIFLKKFSLASLRLFWEKEILCSCSSLKFVWAYQKQQMKIVPKW